MTLYIQTCELQNKELANCTEWVFCVTGKKNRKRAQEKIKKLQKGDSSTESRLFFLCTKRKSCERRLASLEKTFSLQKSHRKPDSGGKK